MATDPIGFLPLDLIRAGRARHLTAGCFAQVSELPGAECFIGSCNGFRVAVVFDDQPTWSVDAGDLSGAALWVPEIEFVVDWDSFQVLDHIDDKLGALGIKGGSLFMAALPPSKVGYVEVELGTTEATLSETSYGFTRWKAVARHRDQTFSLFRRG